MEILNYLRITIVAAFIVVLIAACKDNQEQALASNGKEYHVAKTGDDRNEGSSSSPLLSIQAAAELAEPGDVITVHEGIYRERVNPPLGGTGNDMRIVY